MAITNSIGEAQAREMINTVFAAVLDALLEDQRVSIRGFGSFEVREHKAKHGRNPRTGERLVLPPRRAVIFTTGQALRKSLGRDS